MIVPVAPRLTAVCLACTEPAIVDWLKSKGHEIIDVPFEDTMALGCNFMALGRDRIIAPRSSRALIGQLRARGYVHVHVLKGGLDAWVLRGYPVEPLPEQFGGSSNVASDRTPSSPISPG